MNFSQDTKKMEFTQNENIQQENIFSINEKDLNTKQDPSFYSVNNLEHDKEAQDKAVKTLIDQLTEIGSQQVTTERKKYRKKKSLPRFNGKQKKKILAQSIKDLGTLIEHLEGKEKKVVQDFMLAFLKDKRTLQGAMKFKDQDILIDCLLLNNDQKDQLIHIQKQPDLFQIVLKLILYKLFREQFILTEEIQEGSFVKQSYDDKSQYEFKEDKQIVVNKYIVEKPLEVVQQFFVRFYNYNKVVENIDFDQRNSNQLTTLEGTVIKLSNIEVAASGMEFRCQECGFKTFKKFKDFVFKQPKKCKSCTGKQFIPVASKSSIELFQKAVIRSYIDEVFQTVDISLELSLVDKLNIGDDIRVLGTIRPQFIGRDEYFGKNKSSLGAIYSDYIQANSIIVLDQVIEIPQDKKIQEGLTQFSDLTEQQQITSQFLLPCPTRKPIIIENQLYFQDLHQIERDIFLEILDQKIAFECLIAFFCPKQKNCLMEKALIVLANICQNYPMHLIFIGGNQSIKIGLMKYASKIAVKTSNDQSLTLFPIFDTGKYFKKTICPGRIALSDNGILSLLNLQQYDKKELLKLKQFIENKKLFLLKYPQALKVKCNTSLICSTDYDKISKKINLSQSLINKFDFKIFVKDQRNLLLKSISNNLFKNNYISQHQSQFKDFQDENFSGYMKKRINELDIKNKYKILENPFTYRKFLRFIQNSIDPKLSRKGCEYLKDFYIELKNDFKLNDQQLNIQFFNSILKLLKARSKINFRKQISMNMIDEMIELVKEYLINNFSDQFEKVGSNNNEKKTKPLSEAKKQKMFLQKLKEIIESKNQEIFEMKELEQICDQLQLKILGFQMFIEKLNNEGVLLKESKDLYRVYGL